MKKTLILSLSLVISVLSTSCKSEEKKNVEKEKIVTSHPFSLKQASNTIGWVAYKTTSKVPVKGSFKKVEIINNGFGNSAKEAINDTEFSIPVSSIFTSDVSRDFTLKKFFFGAMDNTKLLSGKLYLQTDSTGVASIKMNSVTADLPFAYTIDGKKFTLHATMNLKNWKAKKAIDSLNIACKELHKGTDGISKTWDDVAITITSVFK